MKWDENVHLFFANVYTFQLQWHVIRQDGGTAAAETLSLSLSLSSLMTSHMCAALQLWQTQCQSSPRKQTPWCHPAGPARQLMASETELIPFLRSDWLDYSAAVLMTMVQNGCNLIMATKKKHDLFLSHVHAPIWFFSSIMVVYFMIFNAI